MTNAQLSPEQRRQRDLQALVRHMQRQRVAFAEISGMIANAVDRVNPRGRDKAPADPVVKATRKAQRRARAVTRRTRK
jgi:hypothetical protein